MSEKENVEENKIEMENKISKQKKFKTRTIIVICTLVLFAISLFMGCRANYLEILEIGENYVDTFLQNIKYKILIGITNFIFMFVVAYITNKLIKKGLGKFFEEEKLEMPKLPNKSIALIIAIIASIITPNIFLEKVILFTNNTQFGINDPIFNMDLGFYMFQAPLIGLILYYLITIIIGFSIYIAIYYIITFNVYFEGINRTNIKK